MLGNVCLFLCILFLLVWLSWGLGFRAAAYLLHVFFSILVRGIG